MIGVGVQEVVVVFWDCIQVGDRGLDVRWRGCGSFFFDMGGASAWVI
jgi:hypothetical protein